MYILTSQFSGQYMMEEYDLMGNNNEVLMCAVQNLHHLLVVLNF